ncbi:MAG: hypothetical protein ACYCRF_01895 [Acidithiobacillus sp.]
MNTNNDALIYEACPEFDVLVDLESVRRIWQLAFARLNQQRPATTDDVNLLVNNAEREAIMAETREMYRQSVARHAIKKQPFFRRIDWTPSRPCTCDKDKEPDEDGIGPCDCGSGGGQ